MLLNINPLAFAHLQQTPSNVTFGSRFGSGVSSGGGGFRWGRGVGSSGGGGLLRWGRGCSGDGSSGGGGGGVGSGGGGGWVFRGLSEWGWAQVGRVGWFRWGRGVGLRWGRGRVQVCRRWVQVFGLYCYQIVLIIDHVVQLS